jgi:hypothetical protein
MYPSTCIHIPLKTIINELRQGTRVQKLQHWPNLRSADAEEKGDVCLTAAAHTQNKLLNFMFLVTELKIKNSATGGAYYDQCKKVRKGTQ